MKVTIWNEYVHQQSGKILKAYPKGMHEAIAEIFRGTPDIEVVTATLEQPEQGLPDALLNSTDVLIWWGHCAHDKVDDALAERIYSRVVNDGMGAIFLHSAHVSKPFLRLMGTSGSLDWREKNEAERVWTIMPDHPIASGVKQGFRLAKEETYAEPFDIPTPDATIFIGWFSGGNVFRTGALYNRGKGKVFYFQCGHETFPIYYDENVRKVIFNAADFVGNRNQVKNTFQARTQCAFVPFGPETRLGRLKK